MTSANGLCAWVVTDSNTGGGRSGGGGGRDRLTSRDIHLTLSLTCEWSLQGGLHTRVLGCGSCGGGSGVSGGGGCCGGQFVGAAMTVETSRVTVVALWTGVTCRFLQPHQHVQL